MRPSNRKFLAIGAAIGFLCIAAYGVSAIRFKGKIGGFQKTEAGRFEVLDFPLVGIINTIAFSPDGKYLVAGTQSADGGLFWGGTVRIWQVADGKQIFTRDFSQWTKKVVFSNDGRFLAVASSSRSDFLNKNVGNFIPRPAVVTIFNFPEMTIAKEIEFEDIVETICFSPNGTKLAVARSHNLGIAWNPKDRDVPEPEVEIVNWREGSKVRLDSPTIKYALGSNVSMIEFSFDGKRFFMNAQGKGIESFDVDSGRAEGVLPRAQGNAGYFLTPIGERIFWMGGKEARCHNTADHSLISRATFSGETNMNRTSVHSVSSDGKRILGVTTEAPDRVNWEDLDEKKTVVAFRPDFRDARVTVCRFSPTNPDVFAVGLQQPYASALLNPGFPRPERGPVLLFRLKK